MRIIKTYDGMTMNCDVIATIQSVFMNTQTGSISEMIDDTFDPDCSPVKKTDKLK